MKAYDATFRGRLKNAIGITYTIHARVWADSHKEAELKLYETYENISYLVLMEVKNA